MKVVRFQLHWLKEIIVKARPQLFHFLEYKFQINLIVFTMNSSRNSGFLVSFTIKTLPQSRRRALACVWRALPVLPVWAMPPIYRYFGKRRSCTSSYSQTARSQFQLWGWFLGENSWLKYRLWLWRINCNQIRGRLAWEYLGGLASCVDFQMPWNQPLSPFFTLR